MRIREPEGGGPLSQFLAGEAWPAWRVIGGIRCSPRADDKVPATARWSADDQGRRVARYDKIHLFGFQARRGHATTGGRHRAGRRRPASTRRPGALGLSVCYDLRFPELFRAMGGVDLIVLAAAFPGPPGARIGSAVARTGDRESVLPRRRRPQSERAPIDELSSRRTNNGVS